jgi:hypothetical protein
LVSGFIYASNSGKNREKLMNEVEGML